MQFHNLVRIIFLLISIESGIGEYLNWPFSADIRRISELFIVGMLIRPVSCAQLKGRPDVNPSPVLWAAVAVGTLVRGIIEIFRTIVM